MADLNQTVAPLSTIISWFAEDATPTETQFETTWKSFFHKSENIPVEQIYQLAEILNLKAERDHMHFDLAKKDGSNLSVEDINGLKEVLGVALAANGIINNIETTITSEDANALQDGIYKPKTTGVFTAIGLTAKENYTTLFKKLDGVWSVFSEEKLPTLSPTGVVEEGNTEAVSGGEVYDSVNPIRTQLNELEDGLFTKSKNLFDKSKAVFKRLYANGVHTDSDLYYSILDVPINPSTNYALSGMRNNSASYVRVVFWDSNHVVINGASLNGNSQTTQIITTPANAYFMDVMFAQGGGPETVTPFENTFQIELGDEVTEYEPYSSGGKIRPELLPDIQNIENPNIFYQYNPTGFNGYGKFTVYVKKKGSNDLYVGYNVQREVNTDPLVWVDYYRLFGGTEFKYIDGEMSSQSTTILIPSENEFTFIETGKVDHTGGYHGDEIMSKGAFYANGIKIDESNSIPLTSANSFYYIIESNLTETANSSDPNTPISGHPTVALHNKKTMFINGGYICRNELVWEKSITVQALYTGLVCNARSSALNGSNEFLNEGVFDYSAGSNVPKLNSNKAREFYGYNENRSSFITSKMIARYDSNGVELPNYDGMVDYYIQDRSNDAKYYRIIKNKNVEIGERWIVESSVEFSEKS